MISPADFARLFEEHGFSFFTGVPCSLLAGLIDAIAGSPNRTYIPAVREDAALGMAVGSYMGGKRPVVLMQNSGLGYSLNAFTSLAMIYRIPCLIIMSWRGYKGIDAPEHLIMGDIVTGLLRCSGIPYAVLEDGRARDTVEWAVRTLEEKSTPAAILIRKGILG
jgi:sulfopyruvate decarboxylase alpha subunit